MAAIISGSTLSVLFYDHSSNLGNQEGLLTGKVISHVKDTISDSQINNVQVETNVYIYGCTCQSKFESFHDNRGNILHVDKSVVGWYRYRHNSSHRMSMKEKSIHQTLLKNIPPDKQENFLFVLCTSQKSENFSTCDFDYTFFKYSIKEKKYQSVPVTVINLGDTTHTEYKCTRSCTVDYDSGTLASLLSSFEHELLGGGKKTSEAAGVQNMAESLQTQLQCLTHGVMESDHEVHELQFELEHMEMNLQRKKDKKRAMKPLPPSPVSPEPHSSREITKEEALARSKREQKRRDQTNSLYPNLSDLKVSSGGSRTRRLSDDNYLMDLNDSKTSSLHDQMGKKCHLLDSPIETGDEIISPEITLAVGNSGEPEKNSVDDKHIDIPFADSEGFDLPSRDKLKSTATEAESSDPFAFVAGVMANSKCDVSKKKNKLASSNNMTNAHPNESTRMTRSRNNLAMGGNSNANHISAIQNQNKNRNQRSRSTSREKQVTKSSNKQHNACSRKTELNLDNTGSDEDIFDTKDENNDNLNHVIDVSSSPVF